MACGPGSSLNVLGDPGHFMCPVPNNGRSTPAVDQELCLARGHAGMSDATSALRTQVTGV